MKLLIVDDHRLFNDGLKSLLINEPYYTQIDQIYDSREVLNHLQLNLVDVILLDFNMPHANGLEMTSRILQNYPHQKVIILSMYADLSQIEQFKKAGAKGYLLKTVDIAELSKAIQKVVIGEFHFPKKVKSNNHDEDDFLKKIRLTQREFEVIQLIKEGKSSNEMADKLKISMHTVVTHRKNIHLKLNVQNERELIKFAIENNI
jgi:DNA-binding NarL/FixJ family response regulator